MSTHKFLSLVPDTQYHVQVRTTANDGRTSDWSPTLTFRTTLDTTPPPVPTGLTAIPAATNTDSFEVKWTRPTGDTMVDFKHYELRASGNGRQRIYVVNTEIFLLTLAENIAAFDQATSPVAFEVRSVDRSDNKSDWSALVQGTNPAPANVTGTAVVALPNGFKIDWNLVSDKDVKGYRVYVHTGTAPTGGTNGTVIGEVSGTTYTYSTLSYSTDHYVGVRAVDTFGTTSPGITWTGAVRPMNFSAVDTTAPGVPTISSAVITTTSLGRASATVDWTLANAPSDLQGFQIRYRLVGSANWQQQSVTADDRTVFITGIDPYLNYEFQIRAYDFSANYSSWSGITTATGATNLAPAKVTGLTPASSANAITLSWTESPEDDVRNGAGLYEVDIATNAGFTTGLKTYKVGAPSITIGGLSESTPYWVRVRAFDNQGLAGVYSDAATTTTSAFPTTQQSNGSPPPNSPAAVVTPAIGQLFVSWQPVISGTLPGDVVFYEVHLSTTNGFTPTKGATATRVATTPGTFATIENTAAGTALAYGTTYYVRIIAYDSDGVAAPGTQAAGVIAKVTAADSSLTAGDVGAPTTSQFSTLNATVSTSIKSSVNEYASSGSETVAPTTGWSTTAPARTPGSFVWFRTTVTYNDNSTATTGAALLTGNTGATGPAGTPAASIALTASTQVLSAPSSGGATNPATSTVTGSAINTSISVWEYSVDGAAFSTVVPAGTTRSGNVVTITGSSMTARTITVRMADANGVADTMTIARVFDGAAGTNGTNGTPGAAGADAYTILLTNEAQVFAGSTSAALAGTASTSVIAYRGTSQQTATIGSITGLPAGMTTNITGNGTLSPGVTFTVTTAMTSASGTITIPVTVGGISFTKTFSYSIAFAGAAGANGTNGAPAANIVLTSPTQILSLAPGASVTTPASTVITGNAFNTTIYTYEYSVNGGTYSTTAPAGASRTGNSVTVTGSSMTAKTLSVRMSDASGVSDTFTVAKVADGTAGATGAPGAPGTDGTNGTNGIDGANGYTVLLSNEAQVFPGSSTSANAGTFTTQPIAYQGTTQQSVTVGTITGQVPGLTAAITNNGTTAPTVTVTTTTALTTPSGTLTIPLTVNGLAFTQTFSWSVSFAGTPGATGAPGAPATNVDLTTNTQVLASPSGGGATTPATATITGTATNTTISAWDYSVNGATFSSTAPAGVSRTGNTVTLTGSTITARTIAVRATGATGVTDTITVAKVSDGTSGTDGTNGTNGSPGAPGANAYTVILTNEAQTIAGTTTTATAGSHSTSVIAYLGTVQQAATIGTPTGMPTGMTHALTNNGTVNATVTFTVTTAMTSPSGAVTIPVTVAGITFNKFFSYAISFAGTPGATGATGSTGSTGAAGVGISSITPYFQTVTTGAAAPAAPGANPPPAPWTITEPAYTVNTELYRTERILYTNGSFAYTAVSKVSSYAAAATAIQTANGKNTVYYSTGTPGATQNTAGDVWFVRNTTTGVVSAQYEGMGGSSWSPRTLGSTAIASITAGQIATGTLDAITITVPSNGAIQSADYNGTSAGFKLISAGLDIQGGTINAKTLQSNTSFVNTLNVGAGGAVQSTGYTAGGTSGFQLSSSGLVIKGAGNSVSVGSLVSGSITTQTITLAGTSDATGSHAELIVDAYGEIRSNNWSSLSTGYRLYGGGAGAPTLEINQGSIDAGVLRTNSAFITDLTIGRSADAAGTITSFGFSPTNGFRLSKAGLEVNSGTIAARALQIQDSDNIMLAEHATFAGNPAMYAPGVSVSSSASTHSVLATGGKFGPQRLSVPTANTWVYLAATSGTYNLFIEPETTYILSWYAFSDVAGRTMQPRLRCQNSTSYTDATGATATTVATNWTRHWATITTPATALGPTAVYWNLGGAATTVYIDGVQLERQTGGLTTPSPWTPPGLTSINGGIIRTGEIRSNQNISTDGTTQPRWSLNTEGNMQINDAIIRGSIVVGSAASTVAGRTATNVQSYDWNNSSLGWAIRGDGTVDFYKGTFRDHLRIGAPGAEKFFVDGANGNLGIGGTTATSGNFRVTGSNGSVFIGAGSLTIGTNFSVSSTGTLTASDGTIAGWSFNTSSITRGSGVSQVGIASTGNPFWAGGAQTDAPFRVTSDGTMHSSKAFITGTVNASGGVIGGWTINPTSITGGGITLNASTSTISGGTLSGAAISGGSITGTTLSASTISGGTITGTVVVNGTLKFPTFTGRNTSMYAVGGSSTIADEVYIATDGTLNLNAIQVLVNNATVLNTSNKNNYSYPPDSHGHSYAPVNGSTGSDFYASSFYTADRYRSTSQTNGGFWGQMTSGHGMKFDWTGTTYRLFVDTSHVKNFVIDHPTPAKKDTHYLVHTTLEGPENGVYYRGEGKLTNDLAIIQLPEYFTDLVRPGSESVMLTPIWGCSDAECEAMGPPALATSRVTNGEFRVHATGGYVHDCAEFYWEVKGERKDVPELDVQPTKSSITVHGDGPYKYYTKNGGS